MFSRTLTDKGLQFPAPRRFSFVVLVPRWLYSFLAPLKVERRTQMHRFHCLDSEGLRSAAACARMVSSRTVYYRPAGRGRPGRGKERV